MTTPDAPLPDYLVAYLAQRDADREGAAWALFEALTEREQRLVKEAAVIGYVQGVMYSDGRRDRVADATIVYRALTGARDNPDLYPTLANYTPETETETEQD